MVVLNIYVVIALRKNFAGRNTGKKSQNDDEKQLRLIIHIIVYVRRLTTMKTKILNLFTREHLGMFIY